MRIKPKAHSLEKFIRWNESRKDTKQLPNNSSICRPFMLESVSTCLQHKRTKEKAALEYSSPGLCLSGNAKNKNKQTNKNKKPAKQQFTQNWQTARVRLSRYREMLYFSLPGPETSNIYNNL